MRRSEKTTIVDDMQAQFRETPHLVLATFRGLTVNQANELRGRVRRIGGSYRVIKNRLARRAAVGSGAETLATRFLGPCALAMHRDDPVALAKTLVDFAKENPQLELLAGVVDARETIDAAGVKQLAALPGLPELRAQLLGLFQTPATTLLRLLNTPGSQLARAIDARREKLGAASEG